MAYIEISELTETLQVDNDSVFPVVYQGATRKIKFSSFKQMLNYFTAVSYNKTTGVFTFTKVDGTSATLTSDLQLSFKDVSFDSSTGIITFTKQSGETKTLDCNGKRFITANEITKLSGIEAGAQVNVIETVKVNGEALTPDANKAVDIDISGKEDKTNKTSTIDENSTSTQYPNAQAVYNALIARDEEISNLKTKNEMLINDHVPITAKNTEIQLTGTGDLPMELIPYGNISQGDLPSEYQQVEYIESTGTQYIDTGVTFFEGLFYDITLKINDAGGMFGRYSAEGNQVIMQYIVDHDPRVSISYGVSNNKFLKTFHPSTFEKVNIKIINNKLYINNVLNETLDNNIKLQEENITFLLFAQSGVKGNGNIYSAKLYNNTTLIRDLIPCYRKSDNVIGMYDLVNGVFYTNAGTGTFLKGNDTPTTNTPIDVKVVDGEYGVKVENKNRALTTINQTATTSELVYINRIAKIKNGETLYISLAGDNVFGNVKSDKLYIGFQTETNDNVYGWVNGTDFSKGKYITNTHEEELYVGIRINGFTKYTDLIVSTSENTEYIAHADQTVNIDTSPNPLYSENDYYKYLTSEEATFLGLNTGAGWYVYNKWDNQDFTSGVSSVTINDMKSNGQFYSTVGGTVSGTTITFSGTTTGNGNIVYELATPTYTKITNSNLITSLEALKDMQSYYDITNISQTHGNNQADMRINAKALKSLKAMQSEIDELKQAVLNS